MAQWLGVHLPMRGGREEGRGGGEEFKPWPGRIPYAAERLGPCATAAEPALWSPRVSHNY